MTTTTTDNADYCANIVRNRDFPAYAATVFIAPEARRSLLALYAFAGEIARVRDHITQALAGEIRLQWWTDLLEGIGHGEVAGNPVAAELMHAIESHALPRAPLLRMIEAHQFDLYNDPMPDMAALETYAAETSGALFALATRIAAAPNDEVDHLAVHAGVAQGLVGTIRRLPIDANRQQAFVPLDVLLAHGSSVAELFAGQETATLRAARDEVLAVAAAHLDQAMALLADAPAAARPVFLPLAMVRRERERLARTGVFTLPEIPSRLRVLWTLWRASKSKMFS